ncbi:hypothetical protein H5410_061808 [Solanum commersonii]|uniref:Uncharacterized protein n=1 Tax=Solanum commersonii TaxID=4109 RepID=A0A9J5W912_SOLCO|nr:hypothetical protein H5410_061808 [Solanum commersonii]
MVDHWMMIRPKQLDLLTNLLTALLGKVHEADSGHGQIAQTRGIPIIAENTPTSHASVGVPEY